MAIPGDDSLCRRIASHRKNRYLLSREHGWRSPAISVIHRENQQYMRVAIALPPPALTENPYDEVAMAVRLDAMMPTLFLLSDRKRAAGQAAVEKPNHELAMRFGDDAHRQHFVEARPATSLDGHKLHDPHGRAFPVAGGKAFFASHCLEHGGAIRGDPAKAAGSNLIF